MVENTNTNTLGPGYENVPGKEMRFRDIFRDTLRAEMIRDENVFLMGEDISGGFEITYAKKGIFDETKSVPILLLFNGETITNKNNKVTNT